MADPHGITALLQAWSRGAETLEKLMPLVDHELRRIAHSYMIRERHGHTLQTTALINEAFNPIDTVEPTNWDSRGVISILS